MIGAVAIAQNSLFRRLPVLANAIENTLKILSTLEI